MTAIVTDFPTGRIVRRLAPTTPRMTETGLDALRLRWRSGWQASL
jgi:hypothetical protein